MSVNRFKERFKEVGDFIANESPYRSANKGWIADDVYLQWGKTKEKEPLKELDELATVSVFWQPIIQTVLGLFVVISLAVTIAFSPLYFSKAISIANPNVLDSQNGLSVLQTKEDQLSLVSEESPANANDIDARENVVDSQQLTAISNDVENSQKAVSSKGFILQY